MTPIKRFGGALAAAMLCGALISTTAAAAPAAGSARSSDQQHAFDFHFGTWRTHILTRSSTASGATRWVRMTGTVIDQPLWDGRANLEKIEGSGSEATFRA